MARVWLRMAKAYARGLLCPLGANDRKPFVLASAETVRVGKVLDGVCCHS